MTAEITLKDLMAAAFQAVLRSDYAERDRLCAQAERLFAQNGGESLPGDTPAAVDRGKLQ